MSTNQFKSDKPLQTPLNSVVTRKMVNSRKKIKKSEEKAKNAAPVSAHDDLEDHAKREGKTSGSIVNNLMAAKALKAKLEDEKRSKS